MSVWKRLTNVAKGTVKVWQQDGTDEREAALDRELSELERHPAPGEDTARRRRSTPSAPVAWDKLRNPAEEPVPRTDLFPQEAGAAKTDADPESPSDAGNPDDGVKEGRDGRRL